MNNKKKNYEFKALCKRKINFPDLDINSFEGNVDL